jgi:hypothetical protein
MTVEPEHGAPLDDGDLAPGGRPPRRVGAGGRFAPVADGADGCFSGSPADGSGLALFVSTRCCAALVVVLPPVDGCRLALIMLDLPWGGRWRQATLLPDGRMPAPGLS